MAKREVPVQLFDAHCHLQDERLAGDLPSVLERAKEHGVHRLSCNGCFEGDWDRVLQLSQQYSSIVPNFGLHPWWIEKRGTDWLQQLRQKLIDNPTAGLGECGLDNGPKASKLADMSLQREVFEEQLKLAQELHRPVSVHCVRAFGHVRDALIKHHIDVPVVLHSWTGSAEMVKTFLQLPKVYFSLSGYLTKVPPEKATNMVACIPLDRMLLESDCPDGCMVLSEAWKTDLPQSDDLDQYLSRLSHRNEPSILRAILKLLQQILIVSEEEVAEAAFKNANLVFGLS